MRIITEPPTVFLKRRRNALIFSSILFAYYFLHISITQITTLGIAIILNQPARFDIILWALWLYTALHYYQYYKDYKPDWVSKYIERKRIETIDQFLKKHFNAISDKGIDYSNFIIRRHPLYWICIPDIRRRTEFEQDRNYQKALKELQRYDKSSVLVMRWSSIFWLYIKTWYHITFHTTIVTDYYLPFLVIGGCAIYSLIKVILG